MSRLFDAGATARQQAEAKQSRDGAKQRAAEVERILREEGELDNATSDLGKQLAAQGQSMGVEAIHYKEFRMPGSKWMLEHTRSGPDYIYQMFPLRPLKADWRDTIVLLIAAMDAVFPRSIKISYMPPTEKYQIKFFTIRVEGVTVQPGWEDACERRALTALAGVQAWT